MTFVNLQVCYISNAAPHYRRAIFEKMDSSFNCDFFIGDQYNSILEHMDYTSLKGFRGILYNINLPGNFYWQKGAVRLAFKPYGQYLIDGEPYCLSTWVLLLILRLSMRPAILWSHGWYGDENLAKRWIKRFFFSLSSKVLLYGDHARNLMIKQGFDPEKLFCIYNSLDIDQQLRIRNVIRDTGLYKTRFQNSDPVLLFLGRIRQAKQVSLLLRAAVLLNDRDFPCNLVVIGEETEETGLRELAAGLAGKNRVWFVGPLYDENRLADYIYHASVCVSPGSVGLTAIHSLTYGTPVITHDNFSSQGPEFEAITPGVTGDFFKENDIEDLCDKIAAWIAITPSRREIVQQECYKTIEAKYNAAFQIEVLKTAFKA